MSPNFKVVFSPTLIGSSVSCCTVSITPGTLTKRRPDPVSIAPALTSWLFAETNPITVAGLIP